MCDSALSRDPLLRFWLRARSSCRPRPRVPRGGTTDRFVIGQRPFAASSSWNTPIAEDAVYQAVGWPADAHFDVAWSSYSPAIYVASSSDPVVSVRRRAGWGYPAGVVKLRMPRNAKGAKAQTANCWWSMAASRIIFGNSSVPTRPKPPQADTRPRTWLRAAAGEPVSVPCAGYCCGRMSSTRRHVGSGRDGPRRDCARASDIDRRVARATRSSRGGDQRRRDLTRTAWFRKGSAWLSRRTRRCRKACPLGAKGLSRPSKIRGFRHRQGWRSDEPACSGECLQHCSDHCATAGLGERCANARTGEHGRSEELKGIAPCQAARAARSTGGVAYAARPGFFVRQWTSCSSFTTAHGVPTRR